MAQLGEQARPSELAAILNTTMTASAICKSANINPWSERKPIYHSKVGKLTDEEMRGMSSDNAKGIYYGLKCGVQNATAANLHAADWSYVSRPDGSDSARYRFSDFHRYEKDNKFPTLSGSGLANGQEVVYTNNTGIGTMLSWNLEIPGIVDIAKAYSGGNVNYTNIYLCCLVGTQARAMINADAGGVYPLVYNNVKCQTFTFPDLTSIFNSNSLPETRKVTLFLVNGNDIGSFRNSWVDMTTAINLTYKPITLPFQVNLDITFKSAGKIYITALSLSTREYRGTLYLTTTYTKGQDWAEASEYSVLYNVTATGGGVGSYRVQVDKSSINNYIEPTVGEILMAAGFLQDLTAKTYSIQADFQVKATSSSNWATTGYTKSISVQW